jgi:hypothetical protein
MFETATADIQALCLILGMGQNIQFFVSERQSRFLTFGPLTFFPIQINKN